MTRISILLLGLCALAAPLWAEASIEILEPRLHLGEETMIAVTGGPPDAILRATYRPGSRTIVTHEIAVGNGAHAWSPSRAGLVRLELVSRGADAVLAEATIAVSFARVPPSGIAVMVAAGLLLFGGASVAMWMLLTPPPGRVVIQEDVEPPST